MPRFPRDGCGAADQATDLINGLGGEGVALHLEALQVFRQSHLEAEDFKTEVRFLQKPLAVLGVLGGDQRFEQPIEFSFDPFAQDEAVVAGEFAGVVAGPENQIVSLGDDDQFLVFFHWRMREYGYNAMKMLVSLAACPRGPD